MSDRIGRAGLATAVLLQLAAPARADDESAGVVPGPFRTMPGGGARLDAVSVTLGGDKVGIALTATFRGMAAIQLDLPSFGWLGEAETYPDRQFPELAVDVDGRPVSPATDFVAAVNGKDVTAGVRAAGIDPFAIADTPPFVQPLPGRQAAFDALVASGAVTKRPEGFLAGWSASRMVRVAPGAGTHTLGFRYKARPAFVLRTSGSGSIAWGDYCLSPKAAMRLLARRDLRGSVVVQRYGFPVTLDGARPRTTTLRVTGQAGATTIVCGANGMPLIDPVGEVPVMPSADGSVRLLHLARAG